MNFLSNITKGISDYYSQSRDNSSYERFASMSKEELISAASLLSEENKGLKEKFSEITNENNLLKNSVMSNSNKQTSSEFGKIFNSVKNAFILEDENDNENNLKKFKAFLYDQFLFYGGLEEDDINFLNQINININDNKEWDENKDLFIFRQRVLERNYRELFRNLLISKEINGLLRKNGIKSVENKEMKNVTLNDIIYSEKENANKPIQNSHESVKDTTRENIDNNPKTENITLEKENLDNLESIITGNDKIKKTNSKNLEDSSLNKKSFPGVSEEKQKAKKKEIVGNLLESLLDEDEDSSLTFSNMNQKTKWDEE